MSHFSDAVDAHLRVGCESLAEAIAAATVSIYGHGSCGHKYDCDCLLVVAETEE